MRIANFNVQNMRLRRRDGALSLDGAVDRDMADGADPALDRVDRRLTAEVLAAVDADVVAMQEVFDIGTLDHFHDRFLVATGAAPYPHRYCLPGNDGQGMNVALISRVRPRRVKSHASLTADDLGLSDAPESLAGQPLFRRDCLEVELPGLTLYVCHFKAPYPDAAEAAAVRRAEAAGVRRIIERRFADPAEARWLIVGDLNEPAAGTAMSALRPLTEGFAVDLMARVERADRWTYEEPDRHKHSRPDAMLASPALAGAFPDATPRILRAGMSAVAAGGGAFAEVGNPRPHASDHAAVAVDFPNL